MSLAFTLLSERTLCAHNEYVCDWCYTPIVRGEKYVRSNYVYDGFTTEAFHPECYDAMQQTQMLLDDNERCMCKHTRGEICNGGQ